jgi:hypothetical protein
MINNPVGLGVAYINTKANVIADEVSRVKKETNILPKMFDLAKKFPSLGISKRFHLSQELISCIMDALSSKQLIDPLIIREIIQKSPGKIVRLSIADELTSLTQGSSPSTPKLSTSSSPTGH